MKKLLLLLFLTFGLFGFSPNINKYPAKYVIETNNSNVACRYGQCQATAKSTGEQCKHCVSNSGDSYCWQHNK